MFCLWNYNNLTNFWLIELVIYWRGNRIHYGKEHLPKSEFDTSDIKFQSIHYCLDDLKCDITISCTWQPQKGIHYTPCTLLSFDSILSTGIQTSASGLTGSKNDHRQSCWHLYNMNFTDVFLMFLGTNNM